MSHRFSPSMMIVLSLAMMGGCKTDPDTSLDTDIVALELLSLSAQVGGQDVDSVPERTAVLDLVAGWSGSPQSHAWSQTGGPTATLTDNGHRGAQVDLSSMEVAASTELVFTLSSPDLDESEARSVSVVVTPVDVIPAMGPNVQIGGATSAVATFSNGADRWMAYSVGNRVSLTRVQMERGPDYSLYSADYVHAIQIVEYETSRYALLALGSAGIGIVDVTNPMVPVSVDTVPVDYFQDGLSYAEGGGDIIVDGEISSESAAITCLETDGVTLWIGDAGYGLHRTPLSNLLGSTGVVRELNGTLVMENEAFTLQYAGENPWGAPKDIHVVGDRLFVAQGFLGLGIFDAATLERVGGYNLYTDASVVEDWFIDMDIANEVQTDPVTNEPFLDAVTGMPDFRQANFEIEQVWHGDVVAPTPWADFDRYARNYYGARAVEVATQGNRDIAYIAYGLAGLVAVDVTGAGTSTGAAPLTPHYLGYVPAVPAHGPDDATVGETTSLYPHYGAGKLTEAGVTNLSVQGDTVWFSDHFAGLAAVEGAANPQANWHGPGGHYDNDDLTLGDGILGDHWPDYEFVTSYDMSPHDPTDNESLPDFFWHSPILVVTGEVIGHGGAPLVEPDFNGNGPGSVDLIQAAGSGGLATLDIVDIGAPDNGDRFALVRAYPTTHEVGAAPDGSATELISLGHTQGVTSSSRYLYVGDGPHGVSAWEIADADGTPIDVPRLVGNTVQDEYPVTVGDVTVYPATHASTVVFHQATNSVFSLSQSVGLRRVPVADIEAGVGRPGAPILLGPAPQDIFEHSVDAGNAEGMDGQDHAYDAVIEGNLAFVADGSNGLTVYDLTKDPTSFASGYVVGNIGTEHTRPPLGRATGLDLWTHPSTGVRYAFVAAGPRGVGVVDASDPTAMTYIKVFEPIKLEDDTVGKADGRCVDIRVIGDVVWVSYSSFGLVAFSVADLIEPVPEGVDPLEIWNRTDGFDHRPVALDRLDLTDLDDYVDADYEFLYFDHTEALGNVTLFVAAGATGLAVIDGTDPTDIQLIETAPTVHEAASVTISNGRVYVADQSGGVASFK